MAPSACAQERVQQRTTGTLRYRLCCWSRQLQSHAESKRPQNAATSSRCPDSILRARCWKLRCGRDSPERTTRLEESITPKQGCFWLLGGLPGILIKMRVLWTNCVFLLVCFCASGFGNLNRCDEVRKVYQLRQIGPNQLLPLSPRPGMLESSSLMYECEVYCLIEFVK